MKIKNITINNKPTCRHISGVYVNQTDLTLVNLNVCVSWGVNKNKLELNKR